MSLNKILVLCLVVYKQTNLLVCVILQNLMHNISVFHFVLMAHPIQFNLMKMFSLTLFQIRIHDTTWIYIHVYAFIRKPYEVSTENEFRTRPHQDVTKYISKVTLDWWKKKKKKTPSTHSIHSCLYALIFGT